MCVLLQEDGALYITVEKFTDELFLNLVVNLNQNRGPDIDIIRRVMLVDIYICLMHIFSHTYTYNINCL